MITGGISPGGNLELGATAAADSRTNIGLEFGSVNIGQRAGAAPNNFPTALLIGGLVFGAFVFYYRR